MPKYAYSTMLYLVLPPLKAATRLIDLGLDVELSYDNFVFFGGRTVEDRYLDEVIKHLADLQGRIKVLHTPYDELSPQIALSEAGFRRFAKWLDLAYKLGIEIAVVHTLKIGEDYERALDLNLEFIRKLSRDAVDKGVVLAIENRLEKNLFGSKPRDLLRIVNEFGGEVGICLDVGHANINKNLHEFITTAGRYIIALHAHDNDGYKDLHRPPYSGTVNWNLIEEQVTKIVRSTIVFEVVCRDSITTCDKVVEGIRATPIANLQSASYR